MILGVPVGPAATIERFNAMLETVCLCAPEEVYAVGEFYRDFSPTSHERVIQILERYSPMMKVKVIETRSSQLSASSEKQRRAIIPKADALLPLPYRLVFPLVQQEKNRLFPPIS